MSSETSNDHDIYAFPKFYNGKRVNFL